MLIKLIKSVNFKEAHIANRLMQLTETFAVELLLKDQCFRCES